MRDCLSYLNCFADTGVGHYECSDSDITENELQKYFTDGESGCPYFVKYERDESGLINFLNTLDNGADM